jgi:hypothetical protein
MSTSYAFDSLSSQREKNVRWLYRRISADANLLGHRICRSEFIHRILTPEFWILASLYLDSIVVFGADPIHPARIIAILNNLGSDHRGPALRTWMLVGFAFVTKTGTRRFGNFFSHFRNSLSLLLPAV